MDYQSARELLKSHNIKYVLAQFVDIHGVAKTKAVPVDHFDAVIGEGVGFAGFAVWGLGIQPHDAEYMAVGDINTLTVVPWMPGFARIVCNGHLGGQAYEMDSRVVCVNMLKKVKKQYGYEFMTGLEPELFLLKKDPVTNTIYPFLDSDILEKPCYDYKALNRTQTFLTELTDSLIAVGFDVYQIDHEDANGQYEINYTYSDALESADRYIFVKMAASEIARKHGMICSFMPKPFNNRTGNGMHMHMSLSQNGKNLFYSTNDKRGMELSELAYQFIAGVLLHAKALTAIACPTVNSYKRLVGSGSMSGSTWAPVYICYGENNRTAMVRVVPHRLELRIPDSSCNPYLLTAAVLAAGMDGISKKLDPGDPTNLNMYETTQELRNEMKIENLPQNLPDALEALQTDEVITGAVGTKLIKEFIRLKKIEWESYHRYVSDWEVQRYLEFF